MFPHLTRALLLLPLLASGSLAQPFQAGTPNVLVAPAAPRSLYDVYGVGKLRVPDAPTFRERAEKRRLMRQRIEPTVVPTIPRPRAPSSAGRAYEGRSVLDPARAGAFAISGPQAIGRSSVTRPSLAPRR